MTVRLEDLDLLEAGWPRLQIMEVDAAAVDQVPALTDLRDRGYEFRWVQITRVRDLTFSGWEIAFDERGIDRYVYMNRVKTHLKGAQDLVLIMRNSGETGVAQSLLRGQAF